MACVKIQRVSRLHHLQQKCHVLLLRLSLGQVVCACMHRALRQNKEAAALGLLEGHAQQGSRDKDIEVP